MWQDTLAKEMYTVSVAFKILSKKANHYL
ncbi:hypothetical protein ACHAXR_006175 [Thalassiosira sp. AJA248-18]